jgi:hypothetical protein
MPIRSVTKAPMANAGLIDDDDDDAENATAPVLQLFAVQHDAAVPDLVMNLY